MNNNSKQVQLDNTVLSDTSAEDGLPSRWAIIPSKTLLIWLPLAHSTTLATNIYPLYALNHPACTIAIIYLLFINNMHLWVDTFLSFQGLLYQSPAQFAAF
jgi:hypothetical protein